MGWAPLRCEERDGRFVAPAGREVEWTTLASEASLLPNTLDGEPHGHVIDKLEALQAYQACLDDREFVFQLERGGEPTEVYIVIEE